jgi:hypothetical protein
LLLDVVTSTCLDESCTSFWNTGVGSKNYFDFRSTSTIFSVPDSIAWIAYCSPGVELAGMVMKTTSERIGISGTQNSCNSMTKVDFPVNTFYALTIFFHASSKAIHCLRFFTTNGPLDVGKCSGNSEVFFVSPVYGFQFMGIEFNLVDGYYTGIKLCIINSLVVNKVTYTLTHVANRTIYDEVKAYFGVQLNTNDTEATVEFSETKTTSFQVARTQSTTIETIFSSMTSNSIDKTRSGTIGGTVSSEIGGVGVEVTGSYTDSTTKNFLSEFTSSYSTSNTDSFLQHNTTTTEIQNKLSATFKSKGCYNVIVRETRNETIYNVSANINSRNSLGDFCNLGDSEWLGAEALTVTTLTKKIISMDYGNCF